MRRSLLPLTCGFALLLAVGLARHEMWRDELQAWMIVRASPTVPALFDNLRYEGHPALWHLLLLPLARATAQPQAMQALHLLIAALGVALFAAWAPLPLPLRALFACGYLPLFEYGVISRNYALALPLLWGICRLWPPALRLPTQRRWLGLGGCLALLANTNPYAWLLAAALLATLATETLRDPLRRRELAAAPGRPLAGAGVAVAGLALALWQMLPPPDALYADGFHGWWAPRAWRVLGTSLAGYLPFPDWRTVTPWNSALVARLPPTLLALAAALWLAGAWVLLGSRPARTLFAFGSAALLLFTYFQYIGWARHHGHHFLLFVACCWLAALDGQEPVPRRRRRLAALAALLAVHGATALWLYGADLARPFSQAQAAAAALDSPALAGLPAIGYPEAVLPAVGAYQRGVLLSLASGRPLAFVRWRAAVERQLMPAEICDELAVVVGAFAGPVAFVGPPHAVPAGCPAVQVTRVGSAGGLPPPLVPSERLATWRVAPP